MNAHLIDKSGHTTIVDVADFPKQPRIVQLSEVLYSVDDPGFTYIEGEPVGQYMIYHEAVPQDV
jgi:hypothetical protein